MTGVLTNAAQFLFECYGGLGLRYVDDHSQKEFKFSIFPPQFPWARGGGGVSENIRAHDCRRGEGYHESIVLVILLLP